MFATANIYEKDLGKVRIGERVNLKVVSLRDRIFTGKIARIGASVQGETRVVPVQAVVDNLGGQLKPGMFAELEVLTGQQSAPILAIPTSAMVDANGKKIVYVQNGNAYQAAEVTLGQTSGDIVEVKTGLFDGDMIVTQRATQLYAQSLRGGSKKVEEDNHGEEEDNHEEETTVKSNNFALPSWLLAGGGAVIAAGAFATGSFWSNRKRSRLMTAGNLDYNEFRYETEVYLDKHSSPLADASVVEKGKKEE